MLHFTKFHGSRFIKLVNNIIDPEFHLTSLNGVRLRKGFIIHFGVEWKMAGGKCRTKFTAGDIFFFFFQARLSTVDNGFAKDGRHNNVQSLLSRRHFHF